MKAAKQKAIIPPNGSRYVPALVCAIIAILTFALFLPVRNHGFINYDDPDYVSANPITQGGLTWAGIKWAFTTSYSYNWHPLTWISHMVDFQLFGSDPGAHHMVSVLFHAANALLIFLLLRKTTGAVWRSGLVALLFALHPLHVESVAWACERKDVLSVCFGLVSIWFYVRYTQSRLSSSRKLAYVIALISFSLSLMSKPMLVTLPMLFLLLDVWPLNRFLPVKKQGSGDARILWLEKIPFLILTVISSVVTYLAQQKEGAVVNLESYPLSARLSNAVVSYGRYFAKTFWPGAQTIYYEPPPAWPLWQVSAALIFVLVVSGLALWTLKRRPWFAVGWFWFLGTLVPMIGVVQVGAQAIADRYMYFPMIGLTVAVVWMVAEIPINNTKLRNTIFRLSSIAALCGAFFVSRQQLQHWKNSETIFRHALTVSPKNGMAHVMLANTLADDQRFDEARDEYARALAITPNFPEVHYNLANIFVQQNNLSEAEREYRLALQQNPSYLEAHANLAVVLSRQNKFQEAIEHEKAGLNLNSQQPDLLRNMALDLMALHRFDDANAALSRAIELQPAEPVLHLLLGNVLVAEKRFQEAATRYAEALRLKPDFEEAKQRLESARLSAQSVQ